jgi:hypothetical protein
VFHALLAAIDLPAQVIHSARTFERRGIWPPAVAPSKSLESQLAAPADFAGCMSGAAG